MKEFLDDLNTYLSKVFHSADLKCPENDKQGQLCWLCTGAQRFITDLEKYKEDILYNEEQVRLIETALDEAGVDKFQPDYDPDYGGLEISPFGRVSDLIASKK